MQHVLPGRWLLSGLIVVIGMNGVRAASSRHQQPHIILVMADDQGWGQTGYYQHPVLRTPHLDAMAASGLRFDRFYAGAPVCSPTRASVLTGRTNMRTGVNSHGYALRRQERTLASALQSIGYATGHFGKWHLNGLRGPGVPVLASDSHHPGMFGFDHWLSVTNFFDRNPVMSREGDFVEFDGDSSEIIVQAALDFIAAEVDAERRTFTVIWYGTPHSPFVASSEDMAGFTGLDDKSRNQYGELVAMDRSIGALRGGLRELGIADDTLVWFCSDNGGLPEIQPPTTGGLRGFKGSLYEGGIRVPAIVEWPNGIANPRVTRFPAVTMDIFPTIADITGLEESTWREPQDGVSLKPVFDEEIPRRDKPIPFECLGNSAILDNPFKLIHIGKRDVFELYDLAADPGETRNLIESRPVLAATMKQLLLEARDSIASSVAGEDYEQSRVLPGEPSPRFWMDVEAYEPWFSTWKDRPEYRSRLKSKF